MKSFPVIIAIIGVNPYVSLPEKVLRSLFKAAGRSSGHIPVSGTVDGHVFSKYLVKYSGEWRLYLNGITRKAAGKQVGDRVMVTVIYDAKERLTPMPPSLQTALNRNKKAKEIFESLSPSLQKEIKRYINNLKTAEAVEGNTARAIRFLLGEERFAGRMLPTPGSRASLR